MVWSLVSNTTDLGQSSLSHVSVVSSKVMHTSNCFRLNDDRSLQPTLSAHPGAFCLRSTGTACERNSRCCAI